MREMNERRKGIELFLVWLYGSNHTIINLNNEKGEYIKCSEDVILKEYQAACDTRDKKIKEEIRKEGNILCGCNCLFPIESKRCRDNKIQCPYCGGYHSVLNSEIGE